MPSSFLRCRTLLSLKKSAIGMGFMNNYRMKVLDVTMDGHRYVMVPRAQWKAMQRGASAPAPKLLKQSAPLPDGNFGIEHVRVSLANKMIARRKAAGLTQTELARLSGVRVETISRMENGRHMPS